MSSDNTSVASEPELLPSIERSDPLGANAAGRGTAADVVALLRGRYRNPETRRVYRRALEALTEFLGEDDVAGAIGSLLARGPAATLIAVEGWLADMEAEELSAATRRLRLAALRTTWGIAMEVGLVQWPIRVRAPHAMPIRDTRGPGLAGLRALLVAAAKHGGIRGRRDSALVALLGASALRRSEPVRSNVEHFDRAGSRLSILGKGRDEREWVTLPAPVASAVAAYLDARAAQPGEPLFTRLDLAACGRPERLSAAAVYEVVRALGEEAGLPRHVHPHALRHAAITTALDSAGGDVRRVRAFSRHAKVETVLVYDDRRTDAAGEIAGLVTGAIGADLVAGRAPPATKG